MEFECGIISRNKDVSFWSVDFVTNEKAKEDDDDDEEDDEEENLPR